MLAVYSDACKHAIRALLKLAQAPADARIPVAEIRAGDAIPEAALAKVLQRLAQQGIVRSTKGPGGGFQLAQAPEDIRLVDVVEAVDGWKRVDQCALGETTCSEARWCPIHDHWSRAKATLVSMLHETTIGELAAQRSKPRRAAAAPRRRPRTPKASAS